MQGFEVELQGPILTAAFARPMRMLSWSLNRPGFTLAQRVAWLEVKNSDLPIGRDPIAFMAEKLAAAGLADSVQMMTARSVAKFNIAHGRCGETIAQCLATVGLGNAGRAGAHRQGDAAVSYRPGTINLLAAVNQPLSDAAFIEAISIAASARTAAIMDLQIAVQGGTATGTGTDCIVIAAPQPADDPAHAYAGLHTDIGAALGEAVYQAVHQAGLEWQREQRTV